VQVIERKRALVLSGVDPMVVNAIPHAHPFLIGSEQFLAVPHGVDEAAVLRNLGYTGVPAPIKHYYDWPARFSPMAHQKETAAFLSSYRRSLCWNAPGTGKTISALWAADYLMRNGVIRNALIVAPLSTLKPVWGKEIMHHLCHCTFEILAGSKQRKQRQLAKPGIDFFITNHDGFTTMPDAFADIDLVIYDEATALKTPSSRRYIKFATYINQYSPWLWLLTGTPIAQSPADAWTLAKMVNSPLVPNSYSTFKDMVCRRITNQKFVPREEALDICKKVLIPSIRYDLGECVDLPDTTYVPIDCELTKTQMEAMFVLEAEAALVAENINAANAAVLLNKLLQLACGVVYDTDGNAVQFDDSDRVTALLDLIASIGDKVIVFVPLRSVMTRLMAVLQQHKISVALVNGDVGKAARDKIFDDFQNAPTPQVLLAHPKVAAHGLTLTRANCVVWYAPVYSLEQYEQANARIKRLSTKGKTVVYHIAACGLEREMYRRLKEKQRVLANFLALVRGVND
jgi:SNF2 family DNA or RNA helicase